MSSNGTLGIYGDSFAANSRENKHIAWYTLLAEKLNLQIFNYEDKKPITYGRGASSFFRAYKLFKKFHSKHQYNIITVSDCAKFPTSIYLKHFGEQWMGLSNVEHYLDMETDRLEAHEVETLKRLKAWYIITDLEYLETCQELMLQEIEFLDKNVVLLPVSSGSFNSRRRENSRVKFNMWEFESLQCFELGIAGKKFKTVDKEINQSDKEDKIACHFTEESNKLFADLILNYIKDRSVLNLPQSIGHDNHWSYYYKDLDNHLLS